jgi:hypothetical protein
MRPSPLLLLAVAATPLQPAFPATPGWYARATSAAFAHEPPCAAVATIAPRERPCAFPHRTVAALPPVGVLVRVVAYGDLPRDVPRARLPLALAEAPVQHCFEGLDCRYAFQQLLVRVRGQALWVWAIYGRAHPSPAQRAAAAREVARLTLTR